MIKIAILDSGVMSTHPEFEKDDIKGFGLIIDTHGKVQETGDYEDEIGHGSALFYIIKKRTPLAEITNIKIYRNNYAIGQVDFEKYLQFIFDNYSFDIINISMGLSVVCSTRNLQKICESFFRKGTLIIAAFDNYGAISFPAALDYVIGVDSSPSLKTETPVIIENSPINILTKTKYMKVAWTNPKYNIIKGTSFVCGEITAWVARLVEKDGKESVVKILNLEKEIINHFSKKVPFIIKRASVFPFNKECHSIARFEKDLAFAISDYYSLKRTGQVGKTIDQIIACNDNKRIVKDVEKIEWNTFDTLILGHTDYLEQLSKRFEIKKELVEEALQRGKNVFMFDYLEEYIDNKNVYMPYTKKQSCIPCDGKLFQTNVPVICVCGTNSKQGKYTLQLYIRYQLIKAGYKVGQIGTEPSALLFGMDEVFHCGYNKHFNLDSSTITTAVNQQIWEITNNGAEVIICGTQSGLIAYNNRNTINSALRHQIVFEAMQPDAIIVCINPYDDIVFIKRVINTAEGLSKGKVIGLVCFPVDYSDQWGHSFMKVQRVSEAKEAMIKQLIKKELNQDVYMLDKNEELDLLINRCIGYLSS